MSRSSCLSQLAEELPSHEPRYILVTYHYEKSDGRVVYPYCMIFSTPEGNCEAVLISMRSYLTYKSVCLNVVRIRLYLSFL
ncbi:unnamed protein product [Echinostoma caproni]|uniref:ADF-H domain-containing protein n=1 Tax=Echinostoma caproni TaxID=27848 RepID=A0A3P8D8C7_9TREM|nr:unnamed protein product [Echinostoma caproni]